MRAFFEQAAKGERAIFVAFHRAMHQPGPTINAQHPQTNRQEDQADAQHNPEPDRHTFKETIEVPLQFRQEGRHFAAGKILEIKIVLKAGSAAEKILHTAAGLPGQAGKNAKDPQDLMFPDDMPGARKNFTVIHEFLLERVENARKNCCGH